MTRFKQKFSDRVVNFFLKIIERTGYVTTIFNPNLTLRDLVNYSGYFSRSPFLLIYHRSVKGKNLERFLENYGRVSADKAMHNPNLTMEMVTKFKDYLWDPSILIQKRKFKWSEFEEIFPDYASDNWKIISPHLDDITFFKVYQETSQRTLYF